MSETETSAAPSAGPSGPPSGSARAGRPSGGLACATPATLTSRFRSLFVVGHGGMGSIEVAVETLENGSERVVALKRMLPSSVKDKRLTEMFLREAKLASMLVHPNVVHAMSFGEQGGV